MLIENNPKAVKAWVPKKLQEAYPDASYGYTKETGWYVAKGEDILWQENDFEGTPSFEVLPELEFIANFTGPVFNNAAMLLAWRVPLEAFSAAELNKVQTFTFKGRTVTWIKITENFAIVSSIV